MLNSDTEHKWNKGQLAYGQKQDFVHQFRINGGSVLFYGVDKKPI